jgi:hypothetical protein
VVAFADKQRVEEFAVDVPTAAVQPPGVLHRCAESDAIPQPKPVGVLSQKAVDFAVMREVWIALVHRKVPEADRALGRVDVQRAIRR